MKINQNNQTDASLLISDGVYAFWKPRGVSSNGFLNKIRKETGIKKIGHTGTLDPLAEGVLVVGIGKGTKLIHKLSGTEKEYIAEVKLGVISETDDEEGEKTYVSVENIPSEDEVKKTLFSFEKEMEQIPPIYSAIKIKGREAYKYARSGCEIKMQSRPAEIKEVELLSYEWPLVAFRVVTGPGVYIRAIARDLGHRLGVGGYLFSLKRIRVGEYTADDAIKL